MSDEIVFDPDFGMVMFPPGKDLVRVSRWNDTDPLLSEFVDLERTAQRVDDGAGSFDVVVALVRRQDNTYNSNAISMAAPRTYGGDVKDRHMGYLLDVDHVRVGGAKFHRLAKALGPVEVGCYARVQKGQRGYEAELYLPPAERVRTLLDAYLIDLSGRSAEVRRRDEATADAVASPRGPLGIPPARLAQAMGVEKAAERHRAAWGVWRPEEAVPEAVKVQQRSVFGHRKVYVVNRDGGRLGEVREGVLYLEDERFRRSSLDALARAGIEIAGDQPQLDIAYPDAAVFRDRGDRWQLVPTGESVAMGWYSPATRVLHVHAAGYADPCRVLLSRYGHTPVEVRWEQRPSEGHWELMARRDGAAASRPTSDSTELVEAQFWRVLDRHRAALPDGLAETSPLRWTTDLANPMFADRDTYWLHHDAYYQRALEALFGAHDRGSWRRGQKPVPCRLCGKDALSVRRRAETGAAELAYCRSCAGKAVNGILVDRGNPEEWEALAVWSLRELSAELRLLPSQAQIPRLVSTTDPDATDRAMLVRMHVPRTAGSRRQSGPQQRAPYQWLDWLNLAGLVGDGVPTARGTASVATDGHLCRSLLERHIDDFLTANRIAHDVEPHWPYDRELNSAGLRADWLLADGTFVEAWGLPDESAYAAKMDRKAELAARFGIRLVGVTMADLGRLHELFADWLAPGIGPVDAVLPTTVVRERAKRPPTRVARPDVNAPGGSARNAEQREARLRRCREAVELQLSGLDRKEIAVRMDISPETLKMLLRDGKFYADPSTDHVRRDLAQEASYAQKTGLTKGQFQQTAAMTTPKANEAWKDADVLFGPRSAAAE